MSKSDKKTINQVAFLAAICMFLSAVEYAIPKPIPFLRLGLANLPILVSLKKISKKEVVLLILLKILCQALISGTLFSYVFLFSLSGSIASGIVMLIGYLIFYKTSFVSNIGLSLLGAFANSAAQLVCSKYIMFGDNVKFVTPVLLISSFITGLALGIFANLFENKSKWYSECCGKNELYEKGDAENSMNFHKKSTDTKSEGEVVKKLWKTSGFRLAISIVFMILLIAYQNIWVQLGIVVLFFILVTVKKHGKIKWFPPLLILIFVTFFNLTIPVGKVLFTVFNWRITLGALTAGLQKSFLLVGMTFISQFAIDKDLRIPGKIGSLIGYIFLIFNRLTEEKISFKRKKVIENIDYKLIQIMES